MISFKKNGIVVMDLHYTIRTMDGGDVRKAHGKHQGRVRKSSWPQNSPEGRTRHSLFGDRRDSYVGDDIETGKSICSNDLISKMKKMNGKVPQRNSRPNKPQSMPYRNQSKSKNDTGRYQKIVKNKKVQLDKKITFFKTGLIKGWYHLSGTCIFPLTQFERNYSTAIQMCGAINHSIGYRETNWLIASQLMEILPKNEDGRGLYNLYWTGLVMKSEEWIGVEGKDPGDIVDFARVYNPLWAEGQPPENLPTSILTSSCLALDLRNSSSFGWRLLPCSTQLPILCQNYGCLPGTFRCLDNSKCIPAGFVNDGFNDCLDGSDETGVVSPTASLAVGRDQSNPTYEWPMQMSSGGVLSPSTVRYGRGECTHKWIVMSPSDRHFVVAIKWLSPSTSTTIFIEGKDQNGTIFLNSRNYTSSISLLSSSFMLTARDTDTRKMEFQIYYQEVDPSICHFSPGNLLQFDSSAIPTPCTYHFSTTHPDSYIALLIKKSEGSPNFGLLEFNNSTVFLEPTTSKKLLIIPTNSLKIHVKSTWPGGETQLEVQFYELKIGFNLDVFMIDREFLVDWKARSEDVWMQGEFRSLSVHMIITGNEAEMSGESENLKSNWQIERFRKTCAEDNVQLISKNTSTYIQEPSNQYQGLGPTSIIIHQSAEPFEFRASYSIPDTGLISTNDRVFLDEEVIGTTTVEVTTRPLVPEPVRANATICPLPITFNSYIYSISSYSYLPGTSLITKCLEGYSSSEDPRESICESSGRWSNLLVVCYQIFCPLETPVEQDSGWSPDTYDTRYGSVRKYKNWTGQAFGPFCVCGDDLSKLEEWKCYNYQNSVGNQEIGGACILPEAQDVWFERMDAKEFDVFPTGYQITMNCYACPNMQYTYFCNNGLWRQNDLNGPVEPYNNFKCDCSLSPDFIDPCLPHGTYISRSGDYSCKCDSGYKFEKGTCLDIDECSEKSDFCDYNARCQNTEGSYYCICPNNYHLYDSREDTSNQWGIIAPWLFNNISCVETTCEVAVDLEQYGLQMRYPGLKSDWETNYKSGTTTPPAYATNLCNAEYPCVVPVRYSCVQTTPFPDRAPNAVCKTPDTNVFSITAENPPYFHIFDKIDVSCKDTTQTLVGRSSLFCNSTLQWEAMPKCVYNSCSNITALIHPPLLIDRISFPPGRPDDKYMYYRTEIFFKCADGYVLHGDASTTCTLFSTGQTRNFIWTYDLPTCVPISTLPPTQSTTSTGSTGPSPSPTTGFSPSETPTILPSLATNTPFITSGTFGTYGTTSSEYTGSPLTYSTFSNFPNTLETFGTTESSENTRYTMSFAPTISPSSPETGTPSLSTFGTFGTPFPENTGSPLTYSTFSNIPNTFGTFGTTESTENTRYTMSFAPTIPPSSPETEATFETFGTYDTLSPENTRYPLTYSTFPNFPNTFGTFGTKEPSENTLYTSSPETGTPSPATNTPFTFFPGTFGTFGTFGTTSSPENTPFDSTISPSSLETGTPLTYNPYSHFPNTFETFGTSPPIGSRSHSSPTTGSPLTYPNTIFTDRSTENTPLTLGTAGTPGTTTGPPGLRLWDFNDVVIEDSVVFEETNWLEKKEIWTMSGDWTWSPSNCLLHQWTFPTSFLVTSTSIPLSSEEIELIIDISQCRSDIQVSIFSSSDSFIPAISDFRTILNTTSSGSVSVKLRNLKPNLAVSIKASGFVQICGVLVREKKCGDVDFDGMHLEASSPFPMRRYMTASCGKRITTVNGYCDSRRGWVIQKTPCLCNPQPPCPATPTIPPIHFRDDAGNCSLNSCENGVCKQLAGTYECVCNEDFIPGTQIDGTLVCVPDHCSYTSKTRNSGYNCSSGLSDVDIKCSNTNLLGSFCQYEGRISNQSYIYILERGHEVAIATNVCNSEDTKYALDNPGCPITQHPAEFDDACLACKGQITNCDRSNPPFYGGAWCLCDAGSYGRGCEITKVCYNTDMSYKCQNGGTCDIDHESCGTCDCKCTSEYEGDYCENYVGSDSCPVGVKDCQFGTCRREFNDLYCNCNPGYLKTAEGNCTIPWDLCSLNNPCQQGGACSFNEFTGIQSCDCTGTYWGGKYCEIQPKLDDCSVCENSLECLDGFTANVRCQCEAGFSGVHCTEPTSDCDFQPCLNNGICNKFNYEDPVDNNLVESYNCTCPTGFSGTNCELTLLRNCQDLITCQNGGTCDFDDRELPFCHCTPQFYGDYCEYACSAQCAHSFGCINNGSVFCDCYDGFSTQFCDVVDDVCKANILLCQNSGTCNSKNQTCDCQDPYYGTYCELNGNYCETHAIDCENGGTCVPETNNFRCECPPNYTGRNCENQIHSCRDITCFNGGTCVAWNATCECLPGSTGDRCQDLGQPCKILLPNGTYTDYCMNGGKCLDLPTGAACDCSGTEYSGRRCDIKANFNFNLVFNGLPYSPDIVSVGFSNSTITQFTLCSFVQYNHPVTETFGTNGVQDVSFTSLPPYLTMRGYSDGAPQLVFDNQGFYICDDSKRCSRQFLPDYKAIPITANTWHHFCVVSPGSQSIPSYTVYLDGVNVWTQYAARFNPGDYGYLQLAPTFQDNSNRFVGMISMTQLYIFRLSEKQIADLAFNCYETITNSTSEMNQKIFINWNGNFTRVSSSNPGVFVDPAGICRSVKCMFGRQVKENNYNSTGSCDKDRISPTVLRCPLNIRKSTTEDFIQVTWPDEDVSFFDNIGVVKIKTNYHNGQQFGIGITTVRYIAYDAAENTAECSFDVIISQQFCPKTVTVVGGTATTVPQNLLGNFASTAVTVTCRDTKFPCPDRPRFYTCDIMGHYNYGGYLDDTRKEYYLPACGDTLPALQSINGTVVGSGSCQQVYQKLQDVIWGTVGCARGTCGTLTILPPCNETTVPLRLQDESKDTVALQYTFNTRNSTENVNTAVLSSLQSNFTVVRQDATVTCDKDHPIKDSSGTITICVSCPGGTFANLTSETCQDCPIDTYRNPEDTDQSTCLPCPVGMITGTLTGAFSDSQCYKNCELGEFEENGICKKCPEGTFGDVRGLRKCVCCGFDTSTDGDGKTSRSDCTKTCPSGQQMERNEQNPVPICVDCPIGYYKEGKTGPCEQCPRGLTTMSQASKSVNTCSLLNCIDANTRRNTNITVTPKTPYSELCIACEQGKFQNISNADTCMPCSELLDTVTEIPITCQSTCSTEIETAGCHCGLQNGTVKTMNCLAVVEPTHQNASAIKIVLPVVFGVLILIVMVVLFCYRKQIIAWFRKTDTSDNQHVAPSHWERPSPPSPSSPSISPPQTSSPEALLRPTIPRPNLRIVTSQEELARLPPLPSSSTPSFHVDSAFVSGGFLTSSGAKETGLFTSKYLVTATSQVPLGVHFEANGSPKLVRSPASATINVIKDSDDSSLDSFF